MDGGRFAPKNVFLPVYKGEKDEEDEDEDGGEDNADDAAQGQTLHLRPVRVRS